MAMASSQSVRSESEMVPELRPVMPVDLFRAVMDGDSAVLTRRLGLQAEEQTETQVTIEDSHSAPEEMNTEDHIVQSELQSATRFGDTILHLLITEGHNELALMVFRRDMSLLKARNNILETPLYRAAKVGNEKVIHNLIQSDPVIVKDALEERNKAGDTALHVAAKNDHRDISLMLMKLDANLAYKVNDKMEYPLYMAIIEGHTEMVQIMLEVDPTLACTPFSDGMFPVHEAARMGNDYLLVHFIKKYPKDADLRDPHGRNFFHIAAEENKGEIFRLEFKDASQRKMIERMHTATNYEGNTPLHIAAKKGHKQIMQSICKHYQVAETIPNKKGYTPLKLSAEQVVQNNEDIDNDMIDEYLKTEGYKFTRKWFDAVMQPLMKNKWERAQIIGLGSVLITTVTFAAAFTIPGGYNQDNGTPVLGRTYMFRAFILANALAFIHGFISLFSVLLKVEVDSRDGIFEFANVTFFFAASSMVVAFGLGMYVTLSPVCLPIAIVILVATLFIGSPAMAVVMAIGDVFFEPSNMHQTRNIFITYVVSIVLIFCLALM